MEKKITLAYYKKDAIMKYAHTVEMFEQDVPAFKELMEKNGYTVENF